MADPKSFESLWDELKALLPPTENNPTDLSRASRTFHALAAITMALEQEVRDLKKRVEDLEQGRSAK
jgi:hypothetical protein